MVAVIRLRAEVHVKLNVLDGKIDKWRWQELASELKKKKKDQSL